MDHIVEICKESEISCKNNVHVLELLSEKVFDFSWYKIHVMEKKSTENLSNISFVRIYC